MADEEVTNDQQPDADAEGQAEDTEAITPESDDASSEPEVSGAEVAPEADAESEPKTETEAESETATATETDADADADAQPEPEAEAGAEPEGETPALSDAEQLAMDALSAARNAVACLDDPESEQAAESEPDNAQASKAEAEPAPVASDSLTGAMMGSGAVSQPTPFTPEQLTQLAAVEGGETIDILADVDLYVKIELGRTKMLVEDVLKLSDGAVVELDKLAGDPVDIYVNERNVARGEVLILNDSFCVRVSEILDATIEDR